MHKYIYGAIALISFSIISAQNIIPTPTNIKATYIKKTRSKTGEPGEKYWQNKANYNISIAFDPKTLLLKGSETIQYFNNSPDTLKTIEFKLYPNFFKKGSMRLMKVESDNVSDGVSIESMSVNNEKFDVNKLMINGTNMTVRIPKLAPKQNINFTIDFSFTLNTGSNFRTGKIDDGAYFLAYFFPRIAVYDDIDGWNKHQYLGTQEFYNDFCDFKMEVKVPNDYMVWATGDLMNCNEVYNDKYCERIHHAETNDEIKYIISSEDLKKGGITNSTKQENTWHFEAKNVTDVAIALSNHYVWQSSSVMVDPKTKRRTRVDAVYNEIHKDFELVASDARKTVEAMSYSFPKWPFPYQHETIFDGLDQMEYPMMVNDNPVEDREESIELTDHEIFHTMFPFYMGINETKYGWMDEGWATIGEWIITPLIDNRFVDKYGIEPTAQNAGKEIDVPITTLTTLLNDTSMFINSYPKPAFGYLFVKDMLGDELFYKGLHYYIGKWNGKHPMPNDFFYCMNTGSGTNLDWFWDKWFFGTGILDLSIKNVKANQITIENLGEKPLPIDLEITFSDGSVEKIHQSIAAWKKGNKEVVVTTKSAKKIKKVVLGSTYVPDSNKKNNLFELK
ncbi:M1 family metallopeptidase [Flavobacterium capsici]|uniref:M1 family metallopeptidase n=1 Tax=Flavobacterium capsici TaxID=3075618 RepID=A0AA96EX22_9FLAO|nr:MULTISPECIES: M1 family metallopeptidase [unclassified Flavobacterium]WNM18773.1 M1 family metallopeptidase [Flavobacterium sp. PMR2A8]WNM22824.1 M1 family metallopeptidase [Flavobacterium sp. PMTSA4]